MSRKYVSASRDALEDSHVMGNTPICQLDCIRATQYCIKTESLRENSKYLVLVQGIETVFTIYQFEAGQAHQVRCYILC